MINWWNSLTPLQQLFATAAIPATFVMLIQTILFFIGLAHGDADGDISGGHHVDVHHGFGHDAGHGALHDGSHHEGAMDHADADSLRLFTVRGLVAFFSIGGWMGLAACSWNAPTFLVVTLALIAGLAALFFVAWSLKAVSRLQSSGNIMIENAIGKRGEVYMTIPASNSGMGKVNIIVQERLCEFDAITDSNRSIKTGEAVFVAAVAREGVLIVEPSEVNSLSHL